MCRLLTMMSASNEDRNPSTLNRVEVRRLMDEVVNSLSTDLRQKGWELIAILTENKLRLTERGEIFPASGLTPIRGSNIKLLVQYTLKKGGLRPRGFSEFLQQLKRSKITPSGISVEQLIAKEHLDHEVKEHPIEIDRSVSSNGIPYIKLPLQHFGDRPIWKWEIRFDSENIGARTKTHPTS